MEFEDNILISSLASPSAVIEQWEPGSDVETYASALAAVAVAHDDKEQSSRVIDEQNMQYT